jgi:hypothetical protein
MQRLGAVSGLRLNKPAPYGLPVGRKSDTIEGSELQAQGNLSTFFHIPNATAN